MMQKAKKVLFILIWLVIWQVAAICVHNQILLVGPIEVGIKFLSLAKTLNFYQICLTSLGRIMAGFIMAFFAGMVVGGLSYRFRNFDEFIAPFLSVVKSIPVASFVVLLLIWQGASNLAIWISFFIVFPNTCVAMKRGLESTDKKMLELADAYNITKIKSLLYIYKPTLIPYLISSLEISIGMSFKSGVAAEVIGTPDYSIGERIYVSKVYLDTAALFAWTITLVLLSYLVEKGILYLAKQLQKPYSNRNVLKAFDDVLMCSKPGLTDKNNKIEKINQSDEGDAIRISNLNKSYDDNKVISNFSAELEKGKIYVLMQPSGYGKTTLFRILSGLEQSDNSDGRVEGFARVTYMFQENRLLENESAICNILLPKLRVYGNLFFKKLELVEACKKIKTADLLTKDALFAQTNTLSGGMKRRVALMRTMFYADENDSLCLLDEPFTGMDEETKKKAISFIKTNQKGKTIILATHDEADVLLLGGEIWKPELH